MTTSKTYLFIQSVLSVFALVLWLLQPDGSIGGQLGRRRGLDKEVLRKRMAGQRGKAPADQVESNGGCFDVDSHTNVMCRTVCQPCFTSFLLRGSLLLKNKDNRLITLIVTPMESER